MFFAHFFNELYIIVMEKFFTCSNIDSMPLCLPEAEIWSRLGRNRFLSRITPAQELECKLLMHKAFAFCTPRGRWRLLEVKSQDSRMVTVEENWCLESAAFAGFVNNAPFLWVGSVTIGGKLEEAVVNSDNLTAAAVYDAVGSECADQAMDMLQKLSAQELARHNLIMSRQRFSPGYGNLSLQVQKKIFEILQLEELNMTLTASNIMQPEKSVTAFAAVNRI